MRSSCVSCKDFKATAPESKQHPASCTRANSQWREKRSSEKIRKRDLVVGNVLANDFELMQTYTFAANELFRLPKKIQSVPTCLQATVHTRALTSRSRDIFLFFFHSKRNPRVSSARFVTIRDLFSHAEWRASYTDTKV